MKYSYDVMFTLPDGYRNYENLKSKKQAMVLALRLIREGATKVFIDTYDGDDDLIDYEQVKEKATSPEIA